MPVTNYYTIDGQMIGYKTAAGRKDFLTDALGSVTAEVDQTSATKTFDGRYKPYGGDLSSTGTRGGYGWVGSWGYRGASLSDSSHYVRARHYSKTSGNWTTTDPIWPIQSGYSYVGATPTKLTDPSGLAPKVNIALSVNVCDANCGGLFNCGCGYHMEYQLDIVVNPNGAKNCVIYQWVKDPGWQKDTGLGWPYPWDGNKPCKDPVCSTFDNPGVQGYAFCLSTIVDDRSFITCLSCDGFCQCWDWEIHSRAAHCSGATCVPKGPTPRKGPCPPFSTSVVPGNPPGPGGGGRYAPGRPLLP